MADSALLAAGGDDAPLSYVVPGATAIRIKQIHVKYVDNSAGADWLPAVRIISDSKHRMGTAADQAVKVTAGSDADVSFFPGVKHAAGAATLPYLNQSQLAQSRQAVQTITSGVVTNIAWDAWQSAPGYGDMFGPTATTDNPVTFVKAAYVVITLTVVWPAANYDRYAELAVGAPSSQSQIGSPRIRHSVSPDGDRQTLSAVIAGDPSNPTTITPRVFQGSGVNRAITAGINYYSIPYGVAPFVSP
jgi:hypothetical protein